MDLYKLKSFYTVASLGSFSRAAEKLYLTQPAVSAQIKDLEYEYKTVLFDRVGRKIQLTKTGEALLPVVEKILNLYEDSHREVNRWKEAKEGSIKLVTSSLPGARILPSLIFCFKKQYPEIAFTISTEKSMNILELIKQNKCDFGITVNSEPSIDRPELVSELLFQDKIVIGVGNGHHLADRHSIRVQDLSSEPLITSFKNTVSRQALDKFFHQYSIPYSIAYEIDSKSMIKTMVEKNLGIAFFSSLEIRKEIASGWIRTLTIEDVELYRYIHLVHHRDRALSPAAEVFCSFLTDRVRKNDFLADLENDCSEM